MSDTDRSDEVVDMIAAVETATDDRELVDLWRGMVLDPRRDIETRTAFVTEANSMGLAERVHAARDRYVDSLIAAVNADQRRRVEELEADLREQVGEYLGDEIGKEYAAKVRADLERSLAETRARFDLGDE